MRRFAIALCAAALLALPAGAARTSDLLSRIDGGVGLGAGIDRARDDFARQQIRSDLRSARNRNIVLEARRPSQLAIGLDNPESDGFADFRELEADIRRLERRQRELDSQLDALPADRAVERDVDRPPERPPFPDQASFAVPRGLEGVAIPETAEARRARARNFVNDLLRANEARGEY